ncbi:hypothetical protein ACTXT7_004778 [Hymenolepis weldensis]
MIPTMNKEKRKSAHSSKHLRPAREEPGERGTHIATRIEKCSKIDTIENTVSTSTTTKLTRQLQHRATSLHFVDKPILGLYNFKLAQQKGQTPSLSKTVKPSKTIQNKLSASHKTSQTAGIVQTSRFLSVDMVSKRSRI